MSGRLLTEQVSKPELDHSFTHDIFKIEVCKTQRAWEKIGQLSTLLVMTLLTAVWTPTFYWRSCNTNPGKYLFGMLLSGLARKTNVSEGARNRKFLKAEGLNFQNHSLFFTFKLSKLTLPLYFPIFMHFVELVGDSIVGFYIIPA